MNTSLDLNKKNHLSFKKMQKLIISLVLGIVLGGVQFFIEKDDVNEQNEGGGHYPIKAIAVFVSVFMITYMGQTLILNGGITIPSGGSKYSVAASTNKMEFEKMMQNVQTGEAPF